MKFCFSLCFLLLFTSAFSQTEGVWLRPNKGQWDEKITHKVALSSGEFMLEENGFTYLFWNNSLHDHQKQPIENEPTFFHAIKSHFLNTSVPTQVDENPASHYRNYFLGKDQSKWASKVYDVQATKLKDIYDGIDLKMEAINGQLKYTWFVTKATDFKQITWNYEGQKDVILKEDGSLSITHSFGEIQEGNPIAWIFRNGKKQFVKTKYLQNEDNSWGFKIDFQLLDTDSLIIDPSLIFSTFTGSTADNWGFTATGDAAGNLYAGGIVFGPGYPVTAGTFDSNFNGVTNVDVGISKFSPTGSQLLYSTYIGGTDSETPNSIFCDQNGELYVFGITGSTNFPMAGASFDPSHNGGPGLFIDNISFSSSDIYIARFNASGTALIASTFLGGSSTDGVSDSGTGTNINFNYGDFFRGEIQVSATHVYIASNTQSTNFPTATPAQASLSGGQDAILVKMPKTLSALTWATFYGGTNYDTGNGLAIASNGDVYLTGGTTTTSLPFGTPGFQPNGIGATDGFVTRFNGTTGALLSGTFIASNEYDQSYFVQTDSDNDVYVFVQSKGSFPITPGCYGQANSGQVIAKFNSTLASRQWITSVGNGSGQEGLSPTAFLVSNCKEIYLAGWGGEVNSTNSLATNSISSGMPVTSDAFQSTSNGNNFWIGILREDAVSLKYGSFMGGTASSFNHVDGGTSRFDKNGNIYHAVCGACGGNNFGFTTTPGVWSTQNLSLNCNLAAFKFELATIQAIVGNPDPLICIPDPVVFNNSSSNGNAFYWNFGDGTTSTAENPSHLYAGPGNYNVTLIVVDTLQCFAPDTVVFPIVIGDFEGGVTNPNLDVCPNVPIQIEAFGGGNYIWSPPQFLNDAFIANPIATVSQNTIFQCIVSDSCGSDTVYVTVTVFGGNLEISNDTSICIGNSVPLSISGVASVTWSPATFLDNPLSFNPISTPLNAVTYTATALTNEGCTLSANVTITVFFTPPVPVIPDTLKYCFGGIGSLTVSGAAAYSWSPNSFINTTTGPSVNISSPIEQYYYCDFINACAVVRDSVYISLVTPVVNAGNDTVVCPGSPAYLWANGGVFYNWSPTHQFLTPSGSEIEVYPFDTTIYVVVGTDQYGCTDTADVRVDVYPEPFIQTSANVYAVYGESYPITATTSTPISTIVWSPSEYLSCNVCLNPIATPDQPFTYTVQYIDENGCTAKDDIKFFYTPLIYVPNTFTPDGNERNDRFFALGSNIRSFELEIYNRWGELIYDGGLLSDMWDGTYVGQKCPDGVYVWKIRYGEFPTDKIYEIVGHVNLLR